MEQASKPHWVSEFVRLLIQSGKVRAFEGVIEESLIHFFASFGIFMMLDNRTLQMLVGLAFVSASYLALPVYHVLAAWP